MNVLDPSAWTLIPQAQANPDQNKMVQGQVPPMLQSNEMYSAPNPQAPQGGLENPAAGASGVGAYLKTTPQVQPKTEPRADRSMTEARVNPFQKAYLQSLNEQGAYLDDAQNNIKEYAAKPTGVDYTALAGYLDSVVPGSKLTQAAMATRGLTEDEKQAQLLKLHQDLGKQKAQFSQENLKTLMNQQSFERLMQDSEERERHNRAEERQQFAKADSLGGRNETMKDTQSQHAADLFDKDPLLIKTNAQRNQIGIDYHTLNNPKAIITSQVADEISTGIATALSGGRSASLGATEMQRMNSVEGEWANLRQKIEGKPMESLPPEFKQQLRSILARLDEGYRNVGIARAKQIHVGRKLLYNPNGQTVMENKLAAYQNAPAAISAEGGDAASGPHGPSVVQDGHTYNWNPSSGRYE